jgi:hypothetical protein
MYGLASIYCQFFLKASPTHDSLRDLMYIVLKVKKFCQIWMHKKFWSNMDAYYITLLQEYEKKMVPWLYSFVVLTIFRFIAWVFVSTVNDLTFGYNLTICILWLLFTIANVYGWLLVYSLYLELADLSKLEDVARLRVSLISIMQVQYDLTQHTVKCRFDEINHVDQKCSCF